jgi:para-nitrobenzyl esterase
LNDMEEYGEKLFARLGVEKESDPLAAVRAIPFERILEVSQAMNEEMGEQYVFMGPWGIVEDGWFMPDSPYSVIDKGEHNAVPMITCANLGELTGPGYVHVPEMIPGYVRLLSGTSRAGEKGYAAIFDQVPSNFREEGGVSAHAMELHYVFGMVDVPETWLQVKFLNQAAGAKSDVPVITDAERYVSEAMMKMWTAFAGTGNPSVKGLIDWPAYDKATDKYLYIVEPLQVKAGFSRIAQNK